MEGCNDSLLVLPLLLKKKSIFNFYNTSWKTQKRKLLPNNRQLLPVDSYDIVTIHFLSLNFPIYNSTANFFQYYSKFSILLRFFKKLK